MLEACMPGTGVDHRGETQLVDTVQTLEQGVFYNTV